MSRRKRAGPPSWRTQLATTGKAARRRCRVAGRRRGGLAVVPLLIGKSLGTTAAALAAERGLPAVWLTPILTVPWVVAAVRPAIAPLLLVVGTGDAMWDGAAARRLSPYVLEVEDADHGVCVTGPVGARVAVLGRVVSVMDEFLDAIAWSG